MSAAPDALPADPLRAVFKIRDAVSAAQPVLAEPARAAEPRGHRAGLPARLLAAAGHPGHARGADGGRARRAGAALLGGGALRPGDARIHPPPLALRRLG